MEAVAVVAETQETLTAKSKDSWRLEFERVAQAMREEARAAGIEEMSMEEIDAEIAAWRKERRELESK